MSVKRLEWEHLQKVLMQYDGNISAAARALNMHIAEPYKESWKNAL